MAAKKSAWTRFPHPDKTFDYAGDKLAKAWPALHAGDAEPFPDAKRAAALAKAAGKAAPKVLDAEALATALQDAWRDFHRGDFQQAFEAGSALGPVGASVACKALAIHASYLVDDEDEQLKRYEQAGKLAEGAIAALPAEVDAGFADRPRRTRQPAVAAARRQEGRPGRRRVREGRQAQAARRHGSPGRRLRP